MRTDIKITMKSQSGDEFDRTLSYVNPNISNETAKSVVLAYANISSSNYMGATRIISIDIEEAYNPNAENKEG